MGLVDQYRQSLARRRRTRDVARGNSAERLYDRSWRAARAAFLLEHPWCDGCLTRGHLKESEEVHHDPPHRGDRVRFWDRSTWVALCKGCHSAITARGG